MEFWSVQVTMHFLNSSIFEGFEFWTCKEIDIKQLLDEKFKFPRTVIFFIQYIIWIFNMRIKYNSWSV